VDGQTHTVYHSSAASLLYVDLAILHHLVMVDRTVNGLHSSSVEYLRSLIKRLRLASLNTTDWPPACSWPMSEVVWHQQSLEFNPCIVCRPSSQLWYLQKEGLLWTKIPPSSARRMGAAVVVQLPLSKANNGVEQSSHIRAGRLFGRLHARMCA
jgi:hypothetical protein